MNKNQEQQNMQKTGTSALTSSVLERIEKEHVQPMPKWQFIVYEYAIWCLWGLSVVMGAIAVAVMIFVSMHAGFAFYEATHETPFSFFIEVLPYLWIVIFIAMALLAYTNMRKTKKGYKYPLWQILISSLIFSIAGGVLLHYAGVGYLIDHSVGKKMPLYPSLEAAELRMWQQPEEGRIVGQIRGKQGMDAVVTFIDIDNQEWAIDTDELMPQDITVLSSGKRVKVLGLVTPSTANQFHGCGVFAWMFNPEVSLADMRNERQASVERIYQHKERSLLAVQEEKQEAVATTLAVSKAEAPRALQLAPRADGEVVQESAADVAVPLQANRAVVAQPEELCAQLKVIQRIEARMQP